MALPVSVDTPEDVWTLVATAVQAGNVWIMKTNAGYSHTYVATGAAAPLVTVVGAPMEYPGLPISVDVSSDIYIKCHGKDGQVMVAV